VASRARWLISKTMVGARSAIHQGARRVIQHHRSRTAGSQKDLAIKIASCFLDQVGCGHALMLRGADIDDLMLICVTIGRISSAAHPPDPPPGTDTTNHQRMPSTHVPVHRYLVDWRAGFRRSHHDFRGTTGTLYVLVTDA